MKIARHSKIIDLINQYDIETQEELAAKLQSRICSDSGDSFKRYQRVEIDENRKTGWGF